MVKYYHDQTHSAVSQVVKVVSNHLTENCGFEGVKEEMSDDNSEKNAKKCRYYLSSNVIVAKKGCFCRYK